MNPRQRRGVFFVLLAGLGALVVFFLVTSYVRSVNSQVAPTVEVFVAARDIPAYSQIEQEDLAVVDIPERYTVPGAAGADSQLVGQRVAYDVVQGTPLGTGLVLPASELNLDEREIAIQVDAVTGIAGRVASGDFVDIYAVFADDEGAAGVSQVLVQSVRVVSVGGSLTRSQETAGGALREAEVVPVTVALRSDDALKVTYADAFALAVRLVGLPTGIQIEERQDEGSSFENEDLAPTGPDDAAGAAEVPVPLAPAPAGSNDRRDGRTGGGSNR